MPQQPLRILTGSDPGDYASRQVAVAMSGGVDSSLAAALLIEAGFEVIGLTMLLLDETYAGTAADHSAVDAARQVASHLGIEHQVIDLRDEFDNRIMSYFTDEYLSGRTPNPCILCNRSIKWDMLGAAAHEKGFDLFATGHYVRIGQYPDGSHILMTGCDPQKDQSYFLYRLSSAQLARTLFPLGTMTKETARNAARERHLPVADRSESQEICFIPDDDYRRFLRHRADRANPPTLQDGPILGSDGTQLGIHHGAALYTIGQRRGLGVAVGYPLYVTAIDAASNTIFAGPREELFTSGLYARDLNWVCGPIPAGPINCTARIRYRHQGAPVRLEVTDTIANVAFKEQQIAVTPGQSVVFYQNEVILGGGIIEKALK